MVPWQPLYIHLKKYYSLLLCIESECVIKRPLTIYSLQINLITQPILQHVKLRIHFISTLNPICYNINPMIMVPWQPLYIHPKKYYSLLLCIESECVIKRPLTIYSLQINLITQPIFQHVKLRVHFISTLNPICSKKKRIYLNHTHQIHLQPIPSFVCSKNCWIQKLNKDSNHN